MHSREKVVSKLRHSKSSATNEDWKSTLKSETKQSTWSPTTEFKIIKAGNLIGRVYQSDSSEVNNEEIAANYVAAANISMLYYLSVYWQAHLSEGVVGGGTVSVWYIANCIIR